MEFTGFEALLGAGGLLLLGYLATLWDKSRNVLVKMMSFIIVPQELASGDLKIGVKYYLRKHSKRRFSAIRKFAVYWGFMKTTKVWRYFAYEQMSESQIVWINFRPVWYSTSNNKKEGSEEKDMIRFIRWTFSRYHFINKAIEILNKEQDRREALEETQRKDFYVSYVVGDINSKGTNKDQPIEAASNHHSGGADLYLRANLPIGFDWDDIGQNEGENAFEDFVTTNAQDKLLEEVDFWLNNQDWYTSKNIPWHRGYVLHGVPGSGKSSFVRAIGQKFDIPIFVFDLASMDNHDFVGFWREHCRLYKKRIIMIEDIDGVFDQRRNIATTGHNQGLTFDCLLNCIDGVDRYDGTLLFITTNKIDTLDPALGGNSTEDVSTRPGRVDRVVELGYMDEEGRKKLITRICGDFMSSGEIENLVIKHQNITPASLQEICFRLALANKWRERDGKNEAGTRGMEQDVGRLAAQVGR